MLSPILERELHQQMEHLPPDRQQQVLDFARALAAGHPIGVAGQKLVSFAGTIDIADLAVMAQVIKEDCEQIHTEVW